MSRLQDLTGQQFHNWVVLGLHADNHLYKRTYWECQCVCGTLGRQEAGSLKAGLSRSCGCMNGWATGRKTRSHIEGSRRYQELCNNAKRRRLEVTLTFEEHTAICLKPCIYCSQDAKYGIDRLDSGIGYTLENCVSCCWICNRMKGPDLSPEQLYAHACCIVATFSEVP